MSYVLATTEKIKRWYVFKLEESPQFYLIDRLDTSLVPRAGNKETAKQWAKALGLKTWSYVRI